MRRVLLELSLLVLGGCNFLGGPLNCGPPPCTHLPAFSSSFGFESDCASTLCGFATTSGSATIVETIHPGEHGMQLTAGTVATATFGAGTFVRSSETLHLVARCDFNARLSAFETVDLRDGNAQSVSAAIPAFDRWRSYDVTFFDAGPSTTPSGETVRPRALTLMVTGTGVCVVDDITYAVTQNQCGGTAFSFDAGGEDTLDAPFDFGSVRDANGDSATDAVAD